MRSSEIPLGPSNGPIPFQLDDATWKRAGGSGRIHKKKQQQQSPAPRAAAGAAPSEADSAPEAGLCPRLAWSALPGPERMGVSEVEGLRLARLAEKGDPAWGLVIFQTQPLGDRCHGGVGMGCGTASGSR
ncbi:UNVERIFIED_CONTAM: hypothetical protein K2H54_043635 [Gekko kuhli]